MKNTFLMFLGAIIFFFSQKTDAQNVDSVQIKLNYLIQSNYNLQNDLREIKLNLKQCHEVYRAGLLMSAGGICITGLGIYFKNNGVIYSGSALSLLGCGTIIYSHNYIKKASIGINNAGLCVAYKL